MEPHAVERTVFLVEDQYPFIEAVKMALGQVGRWKYLGCEWDPGKVDQMVLDHAPDLALVDMSLPVPRSGPGPAPQIESTDIGLETVARIKRLSPQTTVVACSDFFLREPHLARLAYERGAAALLTKQFAPMDGVAWQEWLRSQLMMIVQGQFVPSAVVARLLEAEDEALARGERGPVAAEFVLTARERQVLHLLAQDLSPKLIALQLKIEHATVRSHTRNIVMRFQARNRDEAVQRARELGFLNADHPPGG